MKPAETAQVEFIKGLLRAGEDRKSILSRFVKKWQKAGVRTFDRRLKVAQAAVSAEQKTIQAQAEVEVAKEVEKRKGAIMTAIERKEFLSELIKKPTKVMKVGAAHMMVSEVIVDGKSVIEILPTETKLKALAELNKMDGEYAPTKLDTTVTDLTVTWHETHPEDGPNAEAKPGA